MLISEVIFVGWIHFGCISPLLPAFSQVFWPEWPVVLVTSKSSGPRVSLHGSGPIVSLPGFRSTKVPLTGAVGAPFVYEVLGFWELARPLGFWILLRSLEFHEPRLSGIPGSCVTYSGAGGIC